MAQINAKQALLRTTKKKLGVKTTTEFFPTLSQNNLQQIRTSNSYSASTMRPNITDKPPNNEPPISTPVSSLPTVAVDLLDTLNGTVIINNKNAARVNGVSKQAGSKSQPKGKKPKQTKNKQNPAEKEPSKTDKEDTPKTTPAGFKQESDHTHCSAEVDAKKIWTKLGNRLCGCRKEKILAALKKHNETQQARSSFLLSQIVAHHAYASMMVQAMDERNLHIVWLLSEDENGQHMIRYQLESNTTSPTYYFQQDASETQVALIQHFYESIKSKSMAYQ